MQKLSRQILTELMWLLLCLGVAVLLALMLFGGAGLNGTFDLHLSDTYFVISRWHILSPLFFLVIFVVYFIKESAKSFSRTFPNLLLIIFGLALIVSLALIIRLFSHFSGGWNLYPSLSTPGKGDGHILTKDPLLNIIINSLTVLQFLILSALLFVSYRWGTQKWRKSAVQKQPPLQSE